MKRILVTAFLILALGVCTGDDDGSTELPGQETPSNAVPTVQPDSPAGTTGEEASATPSARPTSS